MGLKLANYEILRQQTKQSNCQTKSVFAVESKLQNIENACTAIKKTNGARWKTNSKQEYVKLSREFN